MKRIQRKRSKGWRMPPNTVYVGRPSKWGNPFRIGFEASSRETAIEFYEEWLEEQLEKDPHFLDELQGKDLACWCPLEDKYGNAISCHADVIIKVMKERGLT